MANKEFPGDIPAGAADQLDKLLLSDTSNGNQAISDTVGDVVKAGMANVDFDDIADGTTNKAFTATEKNKLSAIQPGAQVNQINSVNGFNGVVNLTQDNIPSGSNFAQTENNFSTAKDNNLSAAYSHSQQTSGNPHNVTKGNVGLGNVLNEEQISKVAGSLDNLPEKSDTQYHLDDLMVLQDSSDANNIKTYSNQTNLIWTAGYIQERQPSINYRRFVFSTSTQYVITSLITIGGKIYKCDQTHQSSGTFASDLAAGYWSEIGGGSSTGSNSVTSGSGAPTSPGAQPGDLFVDYTNGNIYYRDGANWVLFTGGGKVSYTTDPTTVGDRMIRSSGTNADLIDETGITIDNNDNISGINDLTVEGTSNFNGETNYSSTSVINNNGGTVNNNGTTTNNTQITENYIDTPNLLGCATSPSFGSAATSIAGTQYAEVIVTFDNGVDGADTKTIPTLLDGVSQMVNFQSGSDTGTISISWTSGDITVSIVSGNASFFTLDDICFYNEVSNNNYENKIHTHNGDITENNNTSEINENTYQYFDSNSTTVHEGDSFFETIEVNNFTITGSLVGANTGEVETFTATASQTNFVLTHTPADPALVWVSLNNGEYGKDGVIYDYTVSGDTVTLTTGATAGDVIQIRYVRSLGNVANLGYVGTDNTVTGANYTPTGVDEVILVDASSNNVSIDLPTAGTYPLKKYTIKRIDSTGNTVEITPNGAELLEFTNTPYALTIQGEYATIYSDGTQRFIIS